jgi:hypothetical protein
VAFVQIIEVSTNKLDELDALVDELQARRNPKGRPTRAMICTDRGRPGNVLSIVEFSSDEAVAASNAEVVNEMGQRRAAITDGPPKFYNLDLRRVFD